MVTKQYTGYQSLLLAGYPKNVHDSSRQWFQNFAQLALARQSLLFKKLLCYRLLKSANYVGEILVYCHVTIISGKFEKHLNIYIFITNYILPSH